MGARSSHGTTPEYKKELNRLDSIAKDILFPDMGTVAVSIFQTVQDALDKEGKPILIDEELDFEGNPASLNINYPPLALLASLGYEYIFQDVQGFYVIK